ncbi:MAG: efflux RND transporter periplasmic adaptor subunit [Thermodesulfobacteriota bacterium]
MGTRVISVGLIVIMGLAGTLLICNSEKKTAGSSHGHGHAHGEGEVCGGHEDQGPNGGKLLREHDFELEVAIVEHGGPPHFRVYPRNAQKPVDTKQVHVTIELERLNEKTSVHNFQAGSDFLFSADPVEEPRSFFVKASARWRGKDYEWEYSQYQGRLTVKPELALTIGLETTVAGPGTIRSRLELPCEIAFDADRVSHVVPRVAGLAVESLKSLGDSVKKGDVLAIIDSRDLGEARSKYLVALEREKLAQYNFDRAQQLWEKQTIPEKEFITAQNTLVQERIERTAAARKLMTMGLTDHDIVSLDKGEYGPLTHLKIKAPFDGTVVKKHLAPGEWVKEDAEIFVVADLSTVWAEVIVYPRDLSSVYAGQKAFVNANGSKLEGQGTVSFVEPVLGEESRTARARVVIPNPEGKWVPGLFAQVALVLRETPAAVTIVPEALQDYRNKPVVFVYYDDRFEARPVELGQADANLIEVRKGLDPGERYATRNSFILKAELGKAGISHQH